MAASIFDAFNLFLASQTGRGNLGTAAQRTLAHQVRTKIWRLLRNDEIEIAGLRSSVMGSSGGLRAFTGCDIQISDSLRDDVAGISVTLVHEVVHEIVDLDYVDEELLCRGLQLVYYAELLPPGVAYADGRGRGQRATLTVGSARETSLRSQVAWARANQLVDYIISMSEYGNSLSIHWVRRNGRNWGGPRNRWATTLGHFLRLLADGGEAAEAGLVVECMEAVSAGRNDLWRELLRTAGGERALAEAVRRPNALYSNEYFARLQALQTRWGVNLGAGARPT